MPGRAPSSSSPLLGNALIKNGEVNGAESCDAFVLFCSFSDTGRSSEKTDEPPREPRLSQVWSNATTIVFEDSGSCCRTLVPFFSSPL